MRHEEEKTYSPKQQPEKPGQTAPKNRTRLLHMLEEAGDKLTLVQYISFLTLADNFGLLNEKEYKVFGGFASMDEATFTAMSLRLRTFLMEKLRQNPEQTVIGNIHIQAVQVLGK